MPPTGLGGPSADELNLLAGAAFSAAQLAKLADLASGAGIVRSERVLFTETAGAGVFTGAIAVPAGALIHDIRIIPVALWDSETSALMDVGEAVDDPDGYFAAIDLKATDLLVGEIISFLTPGGKAGAYINSPAEERKQAYSASARSIQGTITKVGTTGTAGRTLMEVIYSNPTAANATKE